MTKIHDQLQEIGDSGKQQLSVGHVRTAGFYALYDSLIKICCPSDLVVNTVLGHLTYDKICRAFGLACRPRYCMI